MPGTGPALTSMKELLGGLAIATAVISPAPFFFQPRNKSGRFRIGSPATAEWRRCRVPLADQKEALT